MDNNSEFDSYLIDFLFHLIALFPQQKNFPVWMCPTTLYSISDFIYHLGNHRIQIQQQPPTTSYLHYMFLLVFFIA